MKTLRYIVIDAIVGTIIMSLAWVLGTGLWMIAKELYAIYSAHSTPLTTGIAISMMAIGTVVGAIIGFIASRRASSPASFNPETVTPEQLDKMEDIMLSMTANADHSEIDIDEMKKTLGELQSSIDLTS